MTSTNRPRSIEGTIGSRIRVILGETGTNNWLLLLDHDDGDTKWQEVQWNGVPDQLCKQINNCTTKGRYVTDVDFGPGEEWFVNGIKRDGSGDHAWWGGGADEGDLVSY